MKKLPKKISDEEILWAFATLVKKVLTPEQLAKIRTSVFDTKEKSKRPKDEKVRKRRARCRKIQKRQP